MIIVKLIIVCYLMFVSWLFIYNLPTSARIVAQMSKLSISIVVPLSDRADLELLNRLITSIDKQKFKPIEVTLVGSDSVIESAKGLHLRNLMSGTKLNYISGNFTKSKARNIGTTRSKGEFILHIDVDYVLDPQILSLCVDMIRRKDAKAIVLYETVDRLDSIWHRARKLERDLISDIETLSAPQLIEKKVLKTIGGFDEEVDELDDWALLMKLKAVNAKIETMKKPKTKIYEPTNIFLIARRRFNKGRYLKLFRDKYTLSQLYPTSILETYWAKKDIIIRSPSTFLALLTLKVFDTIPFWIGYMFPRKPLTNLAESYKDDSTVQSFVNEQNSVYGNLKSKYEIYTLNKVLKKLDVISALELGCGTGRITKVIIKNSIKVTPTDVSRSMLGEYAKDLSLPKPILIKDSRLPFANESYDAVVAFRVIWHINDSHKREILFEEARRVTKKYILMDLTTSSFLASKSDHIFTQKEIENLCNKSNLKVKAKYWLPLGRSLVLFEVES